MAGVLLKLAVSKCERECGQQVCQNSALSQMPDITVDDAQLVPRYMRNPITKAIVFGGLEPFDQADELFALIARFRQHRCDDDIVIYTGYTESEVDELIPPYENIIMKFGRFRTDMPPRYDDVLGVTLASSNQYAKKWNNKKSKGVNHNVTPSGKGGIN